jgi:acetyltransferase
MPGYPADYIEEIILKDESLVTIRPIRPDDAARLQQGFSMLSQQTIYMRFLDTAKQLSDSQAKYLSEVDYQQRMAMVGAIEEEGEERLVAVARYDMLPNRPGQAEAAIVVRDDYQNRGLGKNIMACLIRYARQHGVQAFIATIHTTNNRVIRFIQKSELPYEKVILEPGVWEVKIDLTQPGEDLPR